MAFLTSNDEAGKIEPFKVGNFGSLVSKKLCLKL